MARGNARTPSVNAYRGQLGRTQTQTVHITGARGDLIAATVHTSIDAVSDPELAERLHSDDPAVALNTLRVDGSEAVRVPVPVVYHDPAAELMVLVLGDCHRHRELEERIAVLQKLAADDAPVPQYAKEFAVVWGGAGLRAYLESRAQQAMASVRETKDLDRRRGEIAAREAELRQVHQDLVRQQEEMKRLKAEAEAQIAKDRADLERLRSELRSRVVAQIAEQQQEARIAQQQAEATTIGPPPSHRDELDTKKVGKQDLDDIETSLGHQALPPSRDFSTEPPTSFADPTPLPAPLPAPALDFTPAPVNGTNGAHAKLKFEVEIDDEPTGTSIIPPGSDPLTTETIELTVDIDPWLAMSATGPTSTFQVTPEGKARLALIAGEQIARGLGGNLDVRVLLHRLATYPVVTLLVGPPAAFRVPSPSQLAVLALDVGAELDRQLLSVLAKRFDLEVDVILRGQPIRRVQLRAPLADNVAYILRAADDHLRGIEADGETAADFARARDLVLGAGYDLLGVEHAEHGEFRDDKLAQVKTAQALRRALAIAKRFARPSREDYLVTTRGFPLTRWRELRRHVVESAVAWGIWMGPELAQVAVSEGLARSRRDLIVKLEAGFEQLRRNQDAFDIDADAADDNVKAIAEEAKALGVELRRKGTTGAIKSEDVSVVSGSIERTPTAGLPRTTPTDELLALLDDKKERVTAAAELCDRGDARAAAPVIGAVKKMSRAEAVQILGKSVKFGAAAAAPLIEGLGSSKAYLRHGCALALALLRTDEGTHAVIDLLVNEPTEIWREIARAIGQIGPAALMPLASHVGRLGDRIPPATAERVAWAMAHIGVRGGRAALEQMASGQSVVAPIAKQALTLHSTAARDEVRVRPGGGDAKDVTVNRAFSRRFFEALEADRPEVAQQAIHEIEADGGAELLDDSDLIVEDDDEAELDESDLIQT
jgi:hypothetical protein